MSCNTHIVISRQSQSAVRKKYEGASVRNNLVEDAVVAGVNVPPPPPLAGPPTPSEPGTPTSPSTSGSPPQLPALAVPPLPQQPPNPPPNPPAAIMATAAPAADAKLHGDPSKIFAGDRSKSKLFIDQFNTFMMINENHTVMQSPYLHTLYTLTKIKGPLVDAWCKDQVNKIREEVTRAVNPVRRDQDVIWTNFETAFTATFTNMAKKQNAANALKQLRMKGNNLDTYTATFKLLVKEAGYDITNPHCFKRYGRGLPKESDHSVKNHRKSGTPNMYI